MEEYDVNLNRETQGQEFLTHFGVKGMRWGIRKSRTTMPSYQGPTPVNVKTKSNSSKIETSGGQNHPASSDAKNSAAVRQKLQKSGINSLSNKEMQDLVNRLNLEQQVSKLTVSEKSQYQAMLKKNMDKALNKGMSQLANKAISLAIQKAFEKPTQIKR